jgi:hypothetical protein
MLAPDYIRALMPIAIAFISAAFGIAIAWSNCSDQIKALGVSGGAGGICGAVGGWQSRHKSNDQP